jgi:hypothetical protein
MLSKLSSLPLYLDDDPVPWPYHVAGTLYHHLTVCLFVVHRQLQQCTFADKDSCQNSQGSTINTHVWTTAALHGGCRKAGEALSKPATLSCKH